MLAFQSKHAVGNGAGGLERHLVVDWLGAEGVMRKHVGVSLHCMPGGIRRGRAKTYGMFGRGKRRKITKIARLKSSRNCMEINCFWLGRARGCR